MIKILDHELKTIEARQQVIEELLALTRIAIDKVDKELKRLEIEGDNDN